MGKWQKLHINKMIFGYNDTECKILFCSEIRMEKQKIPPKRTEKNTGNRKM